MIARAGRWAIALPLYVLAAVLVIPAIAASAVLVSAFGVLVFTLLVPLLIVTLVPYWSPRAYERFGEWAVKVVVLMWSIFLWPAWWLWGLADKVAGKSD